MDNLDHNPTATTATTSFHGTSILVFQHPIKDYKGEERGQLKFGEDKVKVIPELPDSFTNIRPAFFTKKYPVPPKSNVTEDIVTGPDNSLHITQLALEYEWLEKVAVTDGPVDVTWSAHHASKKRHPTFEVGITSLLPLLRDQAHSVATVRHVMDKIKDIVAFLNPGLVPVKKKQPQLAQEFESGKCVVHKLSREFSAMAIDQAHEQANAVVKADGGAIGLTEDPSALRRWMIAGPEISHLVAQYEAASEVKEGTEHTISRQNELKGYSLRKLISSHKL
ncbi:hypothetical protein NQZ68_017564 [Dissostichus eleginoides]|nr:hypothetical protein NQZ68_017564 [Dissostichus eleginoides]